MMLKLRQAVSLFQRTSPRLLRTALATYHEQQPALTASHLNENSCPKHQIDVCDGSQPKGAQDFEKTITQQEQCAFMGISQILGWLVFKI